MIATYTIALADQKTNSLAIGTVSNYLAVGSLVPWIQFPHGLIVSQSFANPEAASSALKILEETDSLKRAEQAYLANDPIANKRQFGIIKLNGETLIHSGKSCIPEVESFEEPGVICLGNMLKKGTIESMVSSYRESQRNNISLPETILRALQAAQKAGGDKRGKLASAMLIKNLKGNTFSNSDTWLDLRVDASNKPIDDLDNLFRLFQLYYSDDFVKEWLSIDDLSDKQTYNLRKVIEKMKGNSDSFEGLKMTLNRHNIGHLWNEEEGLINKLLIDNIDSLMHVL